VAREGILLQHALHQHGEAIDTFAHVDGSPSPDAPFTFGGSKVVHDTGLSTLRGHIGDLDGDKCRRTSAPASIAQNPAIDAIAARHV